MAPTFRLRFNALARLFALIPLGILAAGCGSGSSPPQPPVIGATSFSTNENQPLVTTLQLQDPQGQSMVASVAVQPAHGSLTGPSGDGSFTYQPSHLFYGTDTFKVIVTDTAGASTTALVTVAVQQVNLKPTIQSTSFSVSEDQSLSGDLRLADPQSEPLSVTVSTPSVHGTLTGPDGTGKFNYTPTAHFHGTDSFGVSITDPDGFTTVATIGITVQRVDYPPVAVPDSARTAPGIPVTVQVLANDTEANADVLTSVIISPPANGTATANADGSIAFTPAPGFAGTTSLTYAAVDTSNATNQQSVPTTLTIGVRPLQKFVYLTSSGPNQQVIYNDTNRSSVVSLPIAPNSSTAMQVSASGRTMIYNVRPPSGPQAWVAADLHAVPISPFDTGLGGLGTGSLVLSDSGTSALIPIDGITGYYNSTELFLRGIYDSSQVQVNAGTFATEQVNDYVFSNADATVFYISHSPTDWSSNSTVYLAKLGSSVTQMSPTIATGMVSSLRAPTDGSRIVYQASRNNVTGGVYAVDTAHPGVEIPIAPTVPYFAGTGPAVQGFDVAAQGHVAAVTESGSYQSTYVATAYLSSLDSLGSYTQIGSTLPAGTQLSAPILSPDGQRILMTVLTTAGIALYETTTAHPENLARISPVYPSDRVFAAFKYTQDSSAIVYTADSRAQGTFDIFLIQTNQPGTATQLNAPGSQSVFSPFFSLSPDGSTIAFAQPAVAGGPLALFLVDRSTPGLPFNAGSDVAPLSFGPAPFVIVP